MEKLWQLMHEVEPKDDITMKSMNGNTWSEDGV